MIRCWVFDIDGTLADNTDRVAEFLSKEPKDWRGFFDACLRDPPHAHMVRLARVLTHAYHTEAAPVIYFTGRDEASRDNTLMWMMQQRLDIPVGLGSTKNQTLSGWVLSKRLYMRPDGDHRPDHVLKLEMLTQLRGDGLEPIMVFEDRASVVKMWRDAGVPCAQVAPGDF